MLRARWAWLTVVLLILGATTFIASCRAAQEAIGVGSSPLTVGGVVSLTGGSEVSGDWTPADAGGNSTETLCFAYNQHRWGWSADNGASWNICRSDDASCNGGFGAATSVDSGALVNNILISDPTIVSDKLGHVVYVTLADNNSDCSESSSGVVAVVSPNGGRTIDWNSAVLVNDTACSNGCQDQPDATFDFSTSPPTLLVGFRHAGIAGGAYGACTRRYFIDSANHLQPIDDAQSVGSLGLGNIGAVRLRSGGGVMTVVYSTNGSTPRCPSTATSSEGIATVSSYDWGHSWTGSNTIFSSANYASCVLSQQVDIGVNPRNFDYVRAMDGTNYVVYHDTKSTLRLFMNTTYGGSANPGPNLTWREWCFGTHTSLVDGGPTTNWLTVGASYCATPFYTQGQGTTDAGSGNSLAMPTLASDDLGRLALWFYEADATDTMFHIHFRGDVSPRSPTSTWIDADLSPNFTPGIGPVDVDGGPTYRTLGDYNGIAVRGGFHQQTCGNAGSFFPGWSFADTGGAIDAAVPDKAQTIDGGVVFP